MEGGRGPVLCRLLQLFFAGVLRLGVCSLRGASVAIVFLPGFAYGLRRVELEGGKVTTRIVCTGLDTFGATVV